jgi:hypothetical protein
MTRRAALGAGIVVMAVYALLAVASGSFSVLARRPLLDGAQPPPPYRWVKAPPSVSPAAGKPEALTETIDLSKQERGAGQHATPDRQAQIILDPDSFAPALGKQKLTLTIEPLDPATLGAKAPAGQGVAGNAYRFRLTTAGGSEAPPFVLPGHLVMQYPALSSAVFTEKHSIARLNGSAWEPMETTDSAAVLQAATETTTLGTFAVVSKSAAAAAKPKGAPMGLIAGVAGGVVVVVGGGGYWFWMRQQKIRRRRGRAGARAKKR